MTIAFVFPGQGSQVVGMLDAFAGNPVVADILAQADRANPVDGWYPTSRWRPGEIVRDSYLLPVPEGSAPVAIRIAMYRTDPEAGFVNTPWLSLPVPGR